MKLDTHHTFHQIHNGDGRKFTEQLLEISKHTVSQNEVAVWAKSLRFIAVPKEPGLRTVTSAVTVVKKEEEKGLCHTRPADDKTNINLNCVCDQWPKFPPRELPYLALTDIGDVQNCNHHVAVSYCWSRAVGGRHESSLKATVPIVNLTERQLRPSKRQRLSPRLVESSTRVPYDVMTTEGMRRGRVPRDIMDRALRYAANKGLSFIWIDQECIEQGDPVEKELAIQSMHLVYRCSEFPLGLLTVKLAQQQHVDALNFAIMYSLGDSLLRDADAKSEGFFGTPGRERPIHSFIRNFAAVLKIMARDRWLTRGWIMQEMVLAGEKMVFSMPCDPSLSKPQWGGDVDGELHFTLDQLVPIFDDVLSSDAKAREFDKLISTMDKHLNVGQAFYASYRKLRHITLGTNADGDTSMSGLHRVCNPLAAVLYLEGRSNSRHGDRLAIVGNLCDYAIRLNSTKLDELGFGYSTCLLAIMLLNGDITYMIEWAKALTRPKNGTDTAKQEPPSLDLKWDPFPIYSWMPAPHASLSLGLTYDQFIDNGNLALATIMDPIMQVLNPRLDALGLHLRGWTWNVSEKLELHNFRRTLKKSWPSILEKAERLDDFASLAALVAKLVLDLFSTMLKAGVRDLTMLLWHHLVLNYLGDWSETDGDLKMNSRLPKALAPSLSQLGHILSELAAGYTHLRKTSLSPQLILHLLLTRLEERSTAPPELEWIFNLIMTQGCLRWGRTLSPASSDGHEDQDRAIAVFDCANNNLVLTPQMRDPTKDATERRQWMRHFRQQPGSWIIESQDTAAVAGSSIPIFKTRGMVRGLWRIGDVKPNSADLYNQPFLTLPQTPGASNSLIFMSGDVPVGCILWLHPHQQAQHADIPGLDNNVFKLDARRLLKPRPCMVIDRLPERSGWVKICCLYSFGNRGIENSDRPKEEWRYHVPVYPTPLAWSQTAQLELEQYVYGSRITFRSSYVNTLKSPDVPMTMLSPYKKSSGWRGVRLSERSFDLLREVLALPLPYMRFGDLCLLVAPDDKQCFGPVAQSDNSEHEKGEFIQEVIVEEATRQTHDSAISSTQRKKENAPKLHEEEFDRHHGEQNPGTQQPRYTTEDLVSFSTARLRKEMAKGGISERKDKQETRRELSVCSTEQHSGAFPQTAPISGTKSFSQDELAAFSQSKLRREMKRSGSGTMKSGERMREQLGGTTCERNDGTILASKMSKSC